MNWGEDMRIIKTKYHGEIDFEKYQEYAVKSIFKILPLKEKSHDWEIYLDGLLVELNGMDILTEEVNLMALIAKLEGLKTVEEHKLFRKIVFDCIDLVKKVPIE